LEEKVVPMPIQISVTITKKRVIGLVAVIVIAWTLWWRSQPDPPQVLFVTYVRQNPATPRTVSDDYLINYGYSMCGTLQLKGIDGVSARIDADVASGIAYVGDVSYAAEVNLCPTQNNVPGSEPNGP